MPESISPAARRFVAERIHSVAQLELLLMLRRDPAVEWTAEAAGREMRYPTDWVSRQLVDFHHAGLVGAIERAQQPVYRYHPRSGLGRIVDELADTFSRRRTTVTALIFSRADEDIQCFSDAFRVLREEDE